MGTEREILLNTVTYFTFVFVCSLLLNVSKKSPEIIHKLHRKKRTQNQLCENSNKNTFNNDMLAVV